MAENITIAQQATEIDKASEERAKKNKISSILGVFKKGISAVSGGLDKFLSKRGYNMTKAAQSVKDSKAMNMVDKALDKASNLVGNNKFMQELKEKGVSASISDKLARFDRTGADPPGETKSLLGRVLGIGKTLGEDGARKWKDRGFEIGKDYLSDGVTLVQELSQAIIAFEKCSKQLEPNPAELSHLRDQMDNARARFDHYMKDLARIAKVGRDYYDQAVKLDPNTDKRALDPELAYKKLLVEDKKLQVREFKVNGGTDKGHAKLLAKERSNAIKDMNSSQEYYDSLIQDPNDYGEVALATGPSRDFMRYVKGGTLGRMFTDPIIGEGGKKAFRNMGGNLKGIGDALTGTGREGQSLGRKVLGGGKDILKNTAGMYGNAALMGGSFLGTRSKVLAKNLARGPFGLFEYGKDKFMDGYDAVRGDLNDKAIAEFEESEEQRRLEIALAKDDEKEQKKLKDKYRKDLIAYKKRLKDKVKYDKKKEERGGKGTKDYLDGAKRMLGAGWDKVKGFGKGIFDALSNSYDEDEIQQGLTAEDGVVVSDGDENDPEWVKNRNDEMRETIERNREKASESKRIAQEKLANKNKDNGLLGKLMSGLFGMGKFLLMGVFFPAIKMVMGTIGKFMLRGITGLGSIIGNGLAKLGTFMATKLGSIVSPITTAIGGLGSKIGGWIKNSAVGKAVGGAFNAVKNSSIVKGATNLFGKVANSGFMKGVGRFFKSKAMKVVGKALWGAAKWVGRSILVMTGPIGWVVGVGLLLWDLYDTYKMLTEDEGSYDPDTLNPAVAVTKLRLLAYGLGPDDRNNYNKVLELEENCGQFMRRDDKSGEVEFTEPTEDGIERIRAVLDISEENPELNENKETWFRERFLPVYKSYLSSLWSIKSDLKLGEINKLTSTELLALITNIRLDPSVFNVKVLPFIDTLTTSVVKKDYDEFLSAMLNSFKEKAKKSKDSDLKEIAARNEKTAQDAALDADRKFTDKLKFSQGGAKDFLSKYYKDPKDNNSITGFKGISQKELMGGDMGAGMGGDGSFNLQDGAEFSFGAGKGGDVSGSNKVSLPDAMKRAAEMTGVPEELLWTFAKIESSLNPRAKNPYSSATGLFQFLDGTWKEVVTKYGKKYGLTLQNADRYNPLHSAIMGAEYMKSNLWAAQKFTDVGVDLGTGLYLSHFLGSGGANKAAAQMGLNPDISAKTFFSDAVYKANHSVMKGRSLGQVIAYFQKKFYTQMNIDPTEFPSYREHAKANADLYEDVGEIKYKSSDNKYDLTKGSPEDISNYGRENYTLDGAAGYDFGSLQGGSYGGNESQAYNYGDGIGHGSSSYERNLKNWNHNGTNYSTDGKGREGIGAIPQDIREIYGQAEDGSVGGSGGTGIKIHPIAKGYKYRVSSLFGPRNINVKGASKNHKGVDFAAPTGTPIIATGDGRVIIARPLRGYGNVIYINHGDGLQTRYAHLSAYKVREGASVKAGDIIGLCGNTGIGSGPHLHFEVRRIKGDLPMDPMKFSVIKAGNEGGEAEDKVKDGQIVDTNDENKDNKSDIVNDVVNQTLDNKDNSLSQSVQNSPFGGGLGGMGGIDGMIKNTMANRDAAKTATDTPIMGEDPSNVNGQSSTPQPNDSTGFSTYPGAVQPTKVEESKPVDVKVDQTEVIDGINETNRLLQQLIQVITNNGQAVQKFDTSEITKALSNVNDSVNNIKIPPPQTSNQVPVEPIVKIENKYGSGIDVSRARHNR